MGSQPEAAEKMADDNWVFDSLVGFLRGPVWNVPILTFIEQKSLIFEPDEDEKNEKEYKKIHDDYKNLVDFMLGSYMEDIGIKPKQFEEACGKGSKRSFQHGLFEQVWAADDFEIFKRMMIQKNIELQLQALELLQQRYGVLPESLQPTIKKSSDNENQVLEEIKRISKQDHDSYVASLDKEQAELEKALATSADEHAKLLAAKQAQEMLLVEHLTNLNISSDPGFLNAEISAPVAVASSDEIDKDELAKRTAYLKQQRDKLLAMKKAEREKQLADAEASHGSSRPKSARAARSALGSSGRKQIDPKTLEIRRALAEKLKQEVIDEDNS